MGVLIIFVAAMWASTSNAGPGIEVTRHNLSVSGPGAVRSLKENEICVFCHVAHSKSDERTLWNHRTSPSVTYLPYDSPTMDSRPGQPDGSSRLCLSCHDGTLAVGATRDRRDPIPMKGIDPSGRLRRGPTNLGLDLSGDHPLSMRYDGARRASLTDPRTQLNAAPRLNSGGSLLDEKGKVQCSSCHDPHSDPAALGALVPPFWRGATFSEVCTACHAAPLATVKHDDPRTMPNGCGSCHVGHGVRGEPLLPAHEENACYECHGTPADKADAIDSGRLSSVGAPARVDDLFRMPYRHPVAEFKGVHRSDEDDPRTTQQLQRRHVECVDCHAAHGQPGPIRRRNKREQPALSWERPERVCYRCHGSNGHLPFGQTDKSLEFGAAARSSHPVNPAAGPSQRSPSLLSKSVAGDTMTCGDCHGSDFRDDRTGVHGSRHRWILRGNYDIADGPESEATYELCYECHQRDVVLSDRTFGGHSQHVVAGEITCWACHDSHGSLDYPGLIRFGKDARYDPVTASSTGITSYDPRAQTCTLMCHDVDHLEWGYK